MPRNRYFDIAIIILFLLTVFGLSYYIQKRTAIKLKYKPGDNSPSLVALTVSEVTEPVVIPDDVFTLSEVLNGPPAQDDERILKYITENVIQSPSKEDYSLEHPETNPSMGQGQQVMRILKNMHGGFFIECGALDGETRSNTLYLEKELNWKGLLIEGDPRNYQKVIKKNRKAWTANACLSTVPYPQKVFFQQAFNVGKISKSAKRVGKGIAEVQCFPLFSLVMALNRTEVDYFSLDVEGVELDVLRTIPFDKITFKVLSVEFIHDAEGSDAILNFMSTKGYTSVGKVTNERWLANDFIFVNNKLLKDDMFFTK